MADDEGVRTGIKVSAYTEYSETPLQTISFSNDDYGSVYAEALQNQRQHLLMSKEQHVIAFIMRTYKDHDKRIILIDVDFARKTPLLLNDLFNESFSNSTDKLLLINNHMYILSQEGVTIYDLSLNLLKPMHPFNLNE